MYVPIYCLKMLYIETLVSLTSLGIYTRNSHLDQGFQSGVVKPKYTYKHPNFYYV